MPQQLTRNSTSHIMPLHTRLSTALLLTALVACSSSGGPVPADQVELPAVSFLLPAPIALAGEPGSREESLRLFSAPVLDPVAIEGLATRYEIRSRELLSERRQQLVDLVCALPVAQRQTAVRQLDQARQQQWHRWVNLHNRYEASLRYRLTRTVHPDDAIAGARLTEYLKAREPVRVLQNERQRLVNQHYGDLLAALAAQLGASSGQDCAMPAQIEPDSGPGSPPPTDGAGAIPQQIEGPRELLYLPYYLALYRFLSLLPADERAELLVSLHSGKSSDN